MKVDVMQYSAILHMAETAQDNISESTESLKYLYSLDAKQKDYFLLTEDMVKQFEDLKGACEDYLAAYEYYSKKRSLITADSKPKTLKL